MQARKGQVAMEYMSILALLILVLGYVGYSTLYDSQMTVEMTKAQDAVNSIARAADIVYSLGPCSKTYVFITIPDLVVSSSVGNHTVLLRIAIGNGQSDVYATTIGNVTGYLSPISGVYKIPVEMTCSGVLIIGGGFSINPLEIRLNITHGNSSSFNIELTNNRDTTIENIDYSVSGDISGWTGIASLANSIDSGSTYTFTLDVTVPYGTYSGIYSGTLTITGSENALIEIPIIINVTGVAVTTTSTTSSSTTTTTTSSTTTTIGDADCLKINTDSAYISGSSDDRLSGMTIENTCGYSIELIKARVSWTPIYGEKIEYVKIAGSNRWAYNCGWSCSPTGKQLSGTLLDFGSRDYTLDSGQTKNVNKLEFDSDMDYKNWVIEFTLEDNSKKNATINWSIDALAFDDFEDGWGGGFGWLENWYHTGQSTLTTSGRPYSGSKHLRLRSSSGYVYRKFNTSTISSLDVEFWAKVKGWEAGDEAIFKVSSDGSTWHIIRTWTFSDSNNSYIFYSFDLSNYTATSELWIAFEADMNNNNDYLYIDNLKLVENG